MGAGYDTPLMTDSETNGAVLVPVANPETVDRLLDTAIDIAQEQSLPILALHVVEVPPQLPLSSGEEILSDESEQLIEYVTERGVDTDVEIESKIRYARDTATGIVGSVEAYDAECLLMGWRGRPRRRDILLGSFLDRVLGEAECDVYVKRIKLPSESINSILVPVAGGPHDELATELAATIAAQHDAEITLLHVGQSDSGSGGDEDNVPILRERQELITDDLSVSSKLVESDHVAGAITDESGSHDLTIIGATREPLFKRRLVGSVAQGVGRTASNSVIITRRYTGTK